MHHKTARGKKDPRGIGKKSMQHNATQITTNALAGACKDDVARWRKFIRKCGSASPDILKLKSIAKHQCTLKDVVKKRACSHPRMPHQIVQEAQWLPIRCASRIL